MIDLETQKDPIPPVYSLQRIAKNQIQPISTQNNIRSSTAQTQSPQQLSYTSPIYETYVERSGLLRLHYYLDMYCINLLSQFILTLGFLFDRSDLGTDANLKPLPDTLVLQSQSIDRTLTSNKTDFKITIETFSLKPPENEPDLESIEIIEPIEHIDSEQTCLISVGTKLQRNIQQVGEKSYPALFGCIVVSSNGLDWIVRDADGSAWNVSHHSLVTGLWEIETSSAGYEPLDRESLIDLQTTAAPNTRSVLEVARSVRSNISEIDDELLLEFLHHPQQTEIQELIELADLLVAAQTRDLIQDLVLNLAHDQKMDLWRVLQSDERAAVEALMASIPAPVSTSEVKNGLTSGTIVTTLTGLIGVIKHVFSSVAKPFVVYHEELNRTICYEHGELRFTAE